jgi:ADP-heptose:LPS heptosyltransferase
VPRELIGLAADLLAGARRILVIRPDNIGDVILTGPLFRNLRQHAPDAILGLLASRAGSTAAPLLPWIDEVMESRPVWQDLGGDLPQDPARELAFIEQLRDGQWDAAIIATSFRQTAWAPAYACYLAGIPVRVGFAPDFGGSLLSHPVDAPPIELHQALRNLRLLEGIGVPVDGEDLQIEVPEAALAAVTSRLAMAGIEPGEPILVVPGASASARRMDPERFARAARTLSRATGRPIVVTGSAREHGLVRACHDAIRRDDADVNAIVVDDLDVAGFAALIDVAGVVLCGNSSALHFADALGRPLVAAYAGTDLVSQWEPRTSRASLVSLPVACSPCYRIDCPIGNACLQLDPDELAHRALAVLDEQLAEAPGDRGPARRARTGGAACVA